MGLAIYENLVREATRTLLTVLRTRTNRHGRRANRYPGRAGLKPEDNPVRLHLPTGSGGARRWLYLALATTAAT